MEQGLYHPVAAEAMAERCAASESCATRCSAVATFFQHIALCDVKLDCHIALCDYWSVKEIEFTSAAVRQWRKLIATTREQIDLKLKVFAETGVGDVKALKGVAGCGCAPVTGAFCSR
jgi:hypothetical protein